MSSYRDSVVDMTSRLENDQSIWKCPFSQLVILLVHFFKGDPLGGSLICSHVQSGPLIFWYENGPYAEHNRAFLPDEKGKQKFIHKSAGFELINGHGWRITLPYHHVLALTISLGTESMKRLILELEVDCPSSRWPWPSKTTRSKLLESITTTLFMWPHLWLVLKFAFPPFSPLWSANFKKNMH